MADGKNSVLAFGPFRLFPAERRLENEGSSVPLGGRAFDLLLALVERAGEVVPSRTLMESVWRDVNVADTSLRFHIKNLRKILGDNASDNRYVTNVPGRGYCFAAPVKRLAEADSGTSRSDSFIGTSNLPARASAIVGRSDSIEILTRELSNRRLVTIAGPGGIGKTTLALATADVLRSSFHGGVFFVDLAPIEDPSLMVSAVAAALGIALRANDPLSGVVDFLGNKRILIVLDNCEQLIEAIARLADRILLETDGAHILITSRETLRIAGERVHRLMPLECPPFKANITANEAMPYPAVQLFVDRARANVGDFSLDDSLAPAVVEICQRLDGIPLAIELAAARAEFFGVSALAKALSDMFAVLSKGRRLVLPRHRTLRATLDWGYDLLSPTERTVLRRLAVFRAPFALQSALQVVAGPGASTEDAVEAMAGLVGKSLLIAESPVGIAQYRLLEPTRVYASEKLTESGDGYKTARRHAEYFLKLFTNEHSDRDFDLGAPGPLHVRRIDDVRAALDWSFSQDGELAIGLDLTAASAPIWFRLSLNFEYSGRVERALGRLSDLPEQDSLLELRLQIALGHALWYMQTDAELLRRAFTRALELADGIEGVPHQLRLQALWGMWATRRGTGQYREALAFATRYETVARSVGNQALLLLGNRILGLTHHFLGNQALARQHMEQVRKVAAGSESPPNTEFQLNPEVATASLLTRILWLEGFPDQATAMLDEAVAAAHRSNHRFSISYALTFAGCPASVWTGNLSETRNYLTLISEIGSGNFTIVGLARCWELVLHLRQSNERDALIASYIEPRIDVAALSHIVALASVSPISMPTPNEEVGDALWSLPEVLRVNAELLLWRNESGAAEAAESTLLRSMDLAREQSALSWELRSAMSLARLWRRRGRSAKAGELLTSTYGRFTEGFGTRDLVEARQLIAELSRR